MKRQVKRSYHIAVIAVIFCIILFIAQIFTLSRLQEARDMLMVEAAEIDRITTQLDIQAQEKASKEAAEKAAADAFAAAEQVLTPEEFQACCQVVDITEENWQDYYEISTLDVTDEWDEVTKKVAVLAPKTETGSMSIYRDVTMEYHYTITSKVTYYNESGNVVTLSDGSKAVITYDPHTEKGDSEVITDVYWTSSESSPYLMGWSKGGRYYEFMCKKEKHEVEITDVIMDHIRGQMIFFDADSSLFHKSAFGELYLYVQFPDGLRKYILTEDGILVNLLDENRQITAYYYPDSEDYGKMFQ